MSIEYGTQSEYLRINLAIWETLIIEHIWIRYLSFLLWTFIKVTDWKKNIRIKNMIDWKICQYVEFDKLILIKVFQLRSW